MIFLILALFLGLLFPKPVHAIYDPLSVPNNKFGIHIADSNDVNDVAPLVNSTGGDWGYVTLVIGENDRDPGKWQKLFDQMRRLHLIPIVRLATHIEGNAWSIPKKDSFREWVDFLSKLRWVVKNRYVILFNEPNHANEWGRTINPEEYADMLVALGKELKAASPDFFILPAGMDASADGNGQTLDEATFLRRMVAAKPEIGELIDGWTSHSYPNPGFSGSPWAWGRGTLGTFDWELSYLRQLGVTKPLPVFITETGWIHSEGKVMNYNLTTPQRVGENLQIAAANAWRDPRIVAITPFIFNYQDTPFDHFSWKKLQTNDFYPHYPAYQSITKQKGRPKKREQYEILEPLFPPNMIAGSSYTFTAKVKNTGEAILDPSDGYELVFEEEKKQFSATSDTLPILQPGETGTLALHVKTPDAVGVYTVALKLRYDSDLILMTRQEVTVMPPPSLRISAQLGWRITNTATDVTVLLYKKDTLIQKFTGRTITNGSLTIERLTSIVPNEAYRVVVIVPYYLPRQVVTPISDKKTEITMKRFLPLDVNNDGTLSSDDLFKLLPLQPTTVFQRFFSP